MILIFHIAVTQETTLFRGDSAATKAARAYFRLVLLDYAKETLGPLVREVVGMEDDSYEVM